MQMQYIKKIANSWDTDEKTGSVKQDIIWDLEIKEGHAPCFCSKEECKNDCLWRNDCY